MKNLFANILVSTIAALAVACLAITLPLIHVLAFPPPDTYWNWLVIAGLGFAVFIITYGWVYAKVRKIKA